MSVTYEQASTALRERQSEAAFAHSKGVADTAALLAALYGVDVEKARLAGLLHDWHRELDEDALVDHAEEAEIDVAPEELATPRLLHAKTGAHDVAREFPGIDGEVVAAIEHHTVGAPEMSELDQVVWIADMIEPGRDFAGIDDLRESAGSVSLRDLFAAAYQHSVAHLVATRRPIHPTTLAVWNALVARGRR